MIENVFVMGNREEQSHLLMSRTIAFYCLFKELGLVRYLEETMIE